MASPIPVPVALAIIYSAILVLSMPSGMAQSGTNVMFTDQTLRNDQRLLYSDPTCGKPSGDFVMQGDCNLVLYGGDWQSNTANRGSSCYLTLENNGGLVVRSGAGSVLWRSGVTSTQGKYAAVLHPNLAANPKPSQPMALTVYGPAVWSARNGANGLNFAPMQNKTHLFGNFPAVANLLFSGQILHDGAQLTLGDKIFIMQGDCNLVLYSSPSGWQSNTHGNGQHCFLRLDYNGGLTIQDNTYNKVWSNNVRSKLGSYVAVLQPDGDLAVYGPAIWTTAGRHIGVSDETADIKLVTEN